MRDDWGRVRECKLWRSLETLFVKNKDGGEGGGGLINFPPLKRRRLFEREAQKRICNLIIICKTLKKEGRAFRNISKKYIYSRL